MSENKIKERLVKDLSELQYSGMKKSKDLEKKYKCPGVCERITNEEIANGLIEKGVCYLQGDGVSDSIDCVIYGLQVLIEEYKKKVELYKKMFWLSTMGVNLCAAKDKKNGWRCPCLSKNGIDRPLLSCYPCVEKYIQEMAERIINKEKEDE